MSTAADFPQVKIANEEIEMILALPNQESGFYRGTRFDWSGMIYSLKYKKHEYYGRWFQGVSAKVRDFVYQGDDIIASPSTAATGPAEEFVTADGKALGFDDARPGGTFVKIGVGALRRPDSAEYDHFKLYEIVNRGQWAVNSHADAVEFSQHLEDSGFGYSYIYRKTIRLVHGNADMRIEHSLHNLGKKPITTDVYNHNFLRIDEQPPGPDYSLTVPFEIKSEQPPDPKLAQIRGNQVVYLKPLKGEDRVSTPMEGFGATSRDYDIEIENRKAAAGLRVRADRPLQREFLWSIRAVLCVEPYVRLNIAPGEEASWAIDYHYYSRTQTH